MNKRLLIADDDVQLLEYYRNIFEQDNSLDFLSRKNADVPFVVQTFLMVRNWSISSFPSMRGGKGFLCVCWICA